MQEATWPLRKPYPRPRNSGTRRWASGGEGVATEKYVGHATETVTAVVNAPAVRFARLTLWLAFALIVALAGFMLVSVATFGVPSMGVASGMMGYVWVGFLLFGTGVVLVLIWLAAFGFPERI